MRSGAVSAATAQPVFGGAGAGPVGLTTGAPGGQGHGPGAEGTVWSFWIRQNVSARYVLVMLALLVFPFVATPFITYQIAAQSLILGLIALSLTFLGGYGGMISLAQMTVAGVAGYTIGILGVNATVRRNRGTDIAAACGQLADISRSHHSDRIPVEAR